MRAQPALVRALWSTSQIADAPDRDIYGWVWDNRESAEESARLNAGNHGHGLAVYGPRPVEGGWVVAIDFRPALARATGEVVYEPCEDAGEIKPWRHREHL
jgi:hypothetical protein